MAPITMEPVWSSDTTAVSAVWARTNESVDWIAAATDTFIQGLRSILGFQTWVYISEQSLELLPWPGARTEQQALVAQSLIRFEDRVLPSVEGYSVNLYGGDLAGPEFKVHAGGAHPGGRIPMHTAGLSFKQRSPYTPPRAVIDDLVELAIRAWDPAVVKFTSQTAHMERRRTGWDVPTGYRVWISDETGTFATVPDGLSTRRLANGTLLTTPDDWSPYDMVEAVVEALEANGIEEISN